MALPWFKVTSALVHHPKLMDLEDRLPLDPLGVVIRVWAFTASYYPDGLIPERAINRLGAEAIRGAEPEKEVTVTDAVTALVEAGFLERKTNGLKVHDWDYEQGAHQEAAEKNRERQRRFKEKKRLANVTGVTLGNASEERRVDKIREECNAEPVTVTDPVAFPEAPAGHAQESGKQKPDPWPVQLLGKLRAAFLLTDLDALHSSESHRAFERMLVQSLQTPVAQRIAAAEAFLQRGLGANESPSYLLAMIRKGASVSDRARGNADTGGRAIVGVAETKKLLAQMAANKRLAVPMPDHVANKLGLKPREPKP